jgi:pentatricopeptide repeat protein
MYARCGDFEKAREVLGGLRVRDVVSWSTLIGGYTCKGHCEQALTAFESMKQDGVTPNRITFLRILKACSMTGKLDKGKQIHEEIISSGLLEDNLDLGNALVDMYAKCGALAKARQVLEELNARDVVSWSTLIAGYAEQERGEDALKCFQQMQADGVVPNPITFTYVLKACGSAGVVDKGKKIHVELISQGLLEDDAFLCTAVVDMYAKCGEVERAQRVFDELSMRSVAMWNALIGGYVQEGLQENALNCFEQMKGEGVTPDAVTFVCVLSACSSAGLVDEGRMHFAEMTREYGIMPDIQHNTCMIDLLGCAGMFNEVTLIISDMPSCFDDVFWHALLGACQKWGNVELGKSAFEQSVKSSRRRSS